jgi:hypothetical protein
MKKLDLKILENADLKTAGRIAEMCPSVDETERKGLLRRLKKRCGNADNRQLSVIPDSSDNEEYYEYKLTGAGNMKRKWLKPVRAAVTALVIVGGLAGGFAVVKSMKKDKPTEASTSADENVNEYVTTGVTEEPSDKVTIKLALVGNPDLWRGWQHVWDRIEKYNAESESYYIEVVKYQYDEDDKLGDTSAKKLAMDIISGEQPDIIAATPFQLDKFRNNDYLTDLLEYIDKNDYLDSVIKSVEKNGEIQIIYPEFEVYTACAKTQFVGQDMENWTIQQAIDAYNSFSGDFLSNMHTDYELRHYFFKGVMKSCIDIKSHTCDLKTGLVPSLEFLTSIPAQGKRHGEAVGEVSNNTALVKEMWINGINNYYSGEMLRNFGNEPVTFVGYPTSNGSGTYAVVNIAFGIMDNCSHKKEAWNAIEDLFFDDEFQEYFSVHGYGIPVKKKAVKELFALEEGAPVNKKDQTYSDSLNQSSVNSEVTLPDGSTTSLSSEQIKQFVTLLNELEIDPFVNMFIESVIFEETAPVFDGNTNIEQCVDILNDRLSLYLAENE